VRQKPSLRGAAGDEAIQTSFLTLDCFASPLRSQ
jgi:hypothetical protein